MRYHGRMSVRAAVRLVGLWCLVVLLPREAAAQWYIVGYFGGNTTKAADVLIDRSAANTSLTFHDVEFEAKPLSSPPYYGYRLGRLFGPDRRLGVELEFVHLKVISLTAGAYRITGRANNVAIDTTAAMNTLVERYSMTHGLNFILINLVSRTPVGDGPVTFVARAGAGPTLPHAETTIGGVIREQYRIRRDRRPRGRRAGCADREAFLGHRRVQAHLGTAGDRHLWRHRPDDGAVAPRRPRPRFRLVSLISFAPC